MARKIPFAAETPLPLQIRAGVKDPGWVFPKHALLKTEFLTTCSQLAASISRLSQETSSGASAAGVTTSVASGV
jgi:hypothetical protein